MAVRSGPAAVLLMAYGAPETLDDVADVFTHIRGGRRPPEERIEDLRARYRRIGGGAALHRITAEQAAALESRLAGDGGEPVRVLHGMRHSRPFIADRVRETAREGITRLVGLPLAPHVSTLSVGAYHRALREAVAALETPPRLFLVGGFHDAPGLVAALAGALRETLAAARRETSAPMRVVFTAHSLPERIVAAGEPYLDQLVETARRVAGAAGLEEWELAFQSASPTGEPWLGPDFLDVVKRLGREGRAGVVIQPIGFLADHLEILYDVDILCRRTAEEAGLRMWRTPSMNARPAFIEALAAIVRERLARPPEPA